MVALVLCLSACFSIGAQAQQSGQKKFSSAEEAANALVTATESDDEKAMLEILGPEGRQIVSSGDDGDDSQSRANFVQKYREMHRLVNEADGTTTLFIGAENWPTPIPLLKKDGAWYFDTEAGKREILYRRIGRNELSAIRVCQELVAAQKEFHAAENDQYAMKIFSDEGKRDGLYWKTGMGEAESPIGPLVASAVADEYVKRADGSPTPYRGYYFRILTRQGKNAPGGAKNYVVNGKMTEGFAFVAYPAEYRSSGVMTFVVDQDSVVYEKDLGVKTDAVAKTMKEYNPGNGWQKAGDQRVQLAGEPATE